MRPKDMTLARNRGAIYQRVSSTTGQTVENQTPVLLRMAEQRGFVVVGTYSEQVSAVKKRSEWERLMKDAHRGKMDFVICFALDRVGRSMAGNVQALLDLDARGVRVISVAEPWLDTNGPVRELLIAIMSWVAQQERSRMIERVKLGMDRARREGTHLGRPRAEFDPHRAFELRREGLSYRAIAKVLNVSPATIMRVVAGAPEGTFQRPPTDGGAEAQKTASI